MELINAAQVEWLVKYRPKIIYSLQYVALECTDIMCGFHKNAIEDAKDPLYRYYLTPETYAQLPTEFKQLAQ